MSHAMKGLSHISGMRQVPKRKKREQMGLYLTTYME